MILYDRLIPPTALDHARADAELIYVGKQGDGPQFPQEETDRLLVEHARAGRRVVRLKGGDPFVFGRGGEEALVLREAGIPFEVVPGITAGVAAPAYAGIPVTHRDLASGVAFVTGHEDPRKPESALDWPALAAFPGRSSSTWACARCRGSPSGWSPAGARERAGGGGGARNDARPADRARHAGGHRGATRGRASARRRSPWSARWPRCGSSSPGWRRGPLHGRTVAVTRARAQASALAARLRALGADVVEAPTIRIRPLEVEPSRPRRLRPRLRDLAERRRAPARPPARRPRAGGDHRRRDRAGTARALRARGVEPDVVPERAVAEGLVEALRDVPVRRALIARAAEGRDVLPDALRERGAEVDLLALYETVAEPLDDATRAAAAGADDLLFTSASSVRFYVAAGGSLEGPRLASIGPATSAELRAHGAEPDLEADPHTPDGLVDALLRG